jgi:hypothetical protein
VAGIVKINEANFVIYDKLSDRSVDLRYIQSSWILALWNSANEYRIESSLYNRAKLKYSPYASFREFIALVENCLTTLNKTLILFY